MAYLLLIDILSRKGSIIGSVLVYFFERLHSRVVRVTRFWCRKLPEGLEFEPGLGSLQTEKFFRSMQQ